MQACLSPIPLLCISKFLILYGLWVCLKRRGGPLCCQNLVLESDAGGSGIRNSQKIENSHCVKGGAGGTSAFIFIAWQQEPSMCEGAHQFRLQKYNAIMSGKCSEIQAKKANEKITSLLHINPFSFFSTHMTFSKYGIIYYPNPGRRKLVWQCHSTPAVGWQTMLDIPPNCFTGVIFFLETWGFILKCKEDNDCSIKKSTWSLLPA